MIERTGANRRRDTLARSGPATDGHAESTRQGEFHAVRGGPRDGTGRRALAWWVLEWLGPGAVTTGLGRAGAHAAGGCCPGKLRPRGLRMPLAKDRGGSRTRRTQERGAVRGLRTCAGRGFGRPVSWPGLLGSIVRLPSAVAPLAPRDGSRRATSLTLKSGHRAFQWPGRFSPAAPLRVKCGCTVAQTRRCRSREDNDHTQGLDAADAPDVLTGRPEPRHRAANPRNP